MRLRREIVSLASAAAAFLALAGAGACRQDLPANDPHPEPNSPLPHIQRPSDDGNGSGSKKGASSADEGSKSSSTSDAGK